ncbi:nitrate/nitrite transporter [Saccharicrinis sp. FJH2]|uniref:MFS transporter n=1 Tax=Saccharicrinis sp. FJH65 TaxID=3344659 RepID=UPI0035F30745
MIFGLPFHLPRFFRPTLLHALNMNNTELGDAMSVYGIMAMLSYFPGGILADRFSARKLMSLSQFATGLGGVYMMTLPGKTGLTILYGYWGITTIFLFWAGMLKVTRIWGGKFRQGQAFGILEAGRGMMAAGAASLGVVVLGFILPATVTNATFSDRQSAMRWVTGLYTLLAMLAAVFTWFTVPDTKAKQSEKKKYNFSELIQVLKSRVVWLQALIVIFAYCGFKAIDFYTLYCAGPLGMNEVAAAAFVSRMAYIRIGAAVLAGLLADRFSGSRVIVWLFSLLLIVFTILQLASPEVNTGILIFSSLIISMIAVYALRGVYFAMMEETGIRRHLTGTAIGIISVIGFTPDVFFYPLAGRIIDKDPGLPGFQNMFLLLSLITLAGMATAILLTWLKKRTNKSDVEKTTEH